MDKDKVLLTKSGVEKLEEERDNLINVERENEFLYEYVNIYGIKSSFSYILKIFLCIQK